MGRSQINLLHGVACEILGKNVSTYTSYSWHWSEKNNDGSKTIDKASSGIIEIDKTVEVVKSSPENEPEPDLTLIGFSQVFNADLEVDLLGKQNGGFPLLTTHQNPNSGTMATKNE